MSVISKRDYDWLRFFFRERTVRGALRAREKAFGASIWIGYGAAYLAKRRLVRMGLLKLTRIGSDEYGKLRWYRCTLEGAHRVLSVDTIACGMEVDE